MGIEPLAGIKVIDLSNRISGPYCTKLLAAFGAEVIKVEKPGEGDEARKMGPFPEDKPHPEKSGLFLYLNTRKKGITLDLNTKTGVNLFKEMAKDADVVIENFSPGVMSGLGLDYETLKRINPGLVMTSITHFGQSGPYRDFKATSITDYALSGHLYITGEPHREPLHGPGPQPEYQGGLHGFYGTMLALYAREDTGTGQWIDVSIMECMSGYHQFTLSSYIYAGEIKRRTGNRYESNHPLAIYPCKDGYVSMAVSTQLQQELLHTLMGMPELTEDPRFRTAMDRMENADAFDEYLIPWLRDQNKDDLFHLCSQTRVPCAPVAGPEDLLDDPHYRARGFWAKIDHPEAGKLTYPGAPFKMSEVTWQTGRAPLLGEHNEEIYCERLGYSREDLVRLREGGII